MVRPSRRHRATCSAPIALVAFVTVVTACGSEYDTLTCAVKVGGAQTNVSLDISVGSSTVATVDGYSVVFSILDGHQLEAEVRDAQATTLMRSTAGGLEGGGSVGTPDGRLEYSCAP